jgi:spore maturation protein CgeB
MSKTISFIIKRDSRRFAKKRTRILLLKPFSSGFFGAPYMIEDTIQALLQLGHNVRVIDMARCGRTGIERIESILKEVSLFHPDLVLTFNFIGLVRPLIEAMEKMGLPYVTWFVDDPFRYIKGEIRDLRYCCVFVCDRLYMNDLKDFGLKNIFYLPGATNPALFKPIEEKEKYEVSFVGNSHYRAYRLYCEMIKDVNAEKALGEAVRVLISNPALSIRDILRETKSLLPERVGFTKGEEELCSLVEDAAMAIYRKGVIEALKEVGIVVWGDSGWVGLLCDGIRIEKEVDYHKELPRLYNASKINLNITMSQLKTTLNQRVFDVSACGAFLLTDYRRDLGELFRAGEEIVFYREIDELEELCKYFIKHPEERRAIARKARKRILEEHTYKIRMERLIEIVRGLFR